MSQDAPYAPSRVLADEQAERAILGVLLQRPNALRDSANHLNVDDFYYDHHRHIYAAIAALDDARESIDTITVSNRLDKEGVLAATGGPQYLARLRNDMPLVTNVPSYVTIVRDYALRRRVVHAARETMHLATEAPDGASSIADTAVTNFMSLALSGNTNSVQPIEVPLKVWFQQLEERLQKEIEGGLTGVPSGFYALDEKTNGWQSGDLIILAARPGMGKTALALNLVVNAAIDRRASTPGVVFSLEMGAAQLVGRIMSSMARVPSGNMRGANLSEQQLNKIMATIEELKDLPIFIDETPELTVSEMARKCRQLKHEHGIGFIVVDYLQLMMGSSNARISNREQEISEISRRLKALARELECPVIALSQLNRAVEQRADKRPMLADLRESGAIEQDADMILFLYRQIYYDRLAHKDGEGADGGDEHLEMMPSREGDDAELIIAKHRNGATGSVTLTFHESFTLFTNRIGDRPPDIDDDALHGAPTTGFDPDVDFDPPGMEPTYTPEPSEFEADPAADDDLPI